MIIHTKNTKKSKISHQTRYYVSLGKMGPRNPKEEGSIFNLNTDHWKTSYVAWFGRREVKVKKSPTKDDIIYQGFFRLDDHVGLYHNALRLLGAWQHSSCTVQWAGCSLLPAQLGWRVHWRITVIWLGLSVSSLSSLTDSHPVPGFLQLLSTY